MVARHGADFRTYILAGVITILIFSLGIALGLIIDAARLRSLEETAKQIKVDAESLDLLSLYITYVGEGEFSCPVLETALQGSISEISDSLAQLESYEESAEVNKGEFELLQRGYLLDNLKYWLFARKTEFVCNLDLVPVLYFYSDDHCSICPNQGVILTYYKKVFGDRLLVFPINVDLQEEERMVRVLQRQYNITMLPSLVIDDDKYDGVVSKDSLGKIICSSFNVTPSECS